MVRPGGAKSIVASRRMAWTGTAAVQGRGRHAAEARKFRGDLRHDEGLRSLFGGTPRWRRGRNRPRVSRSPSRARSAPGAKAGASKTDTSSENQARRARRARPCGGWRTHPTISRLRFKRYEALIKVTSDKRFITEDSSTRTRRMPFRRSAKELTSFEERVGARPSSAPFSRAQLFHGGQEL